MSLRPEDAGPVDWVAIRERIAGIDRDRRSAPRTRRHLVELLERRARWVDRRREGDIAPAGDPLALSFRLGDLRLAVDLEAVWAVTALQPITSVPGARALVTGVSTVRGLIVAIVDVAALLSIPTEPEPVSGPARLLVLGARGPVLGMVVHEPLEILPMARDPVPGTGGSPAAIRAEFLSAVSPDGMLFLDAAAIVGDRRLVVEAVPWKER